MIPVARTSMRLITRLSAVVSLCLISGCQLRFGNAESTITQAFRGDYQSGQSSIVSQENKGPNRFDFIEVIQEPGDDSNDLITIASAQFNPATGISRFQFKKPYTCLVIAKTKQLNSETFRDLVLNSNCHWLKPGSRQVFKPIPKR